jgi:hypothetical protein
MSEDGNEENVEQFSSLWEVNSKQWLWKRRQ